MRCRWFSRTSKWKLNRRRWFIPDINRIVTIDLAAYDALAAKDKKTLYLIRG